MWRLVIDECRSTLNVSSDGTLPIDKAITKFMHSPSVAFHLFPTNGAKRAREDNDSRSQPPRKKQPSSAASSSSRKGAGKSKSTPRMPPGLIGYRFQDLQGRPLCFSYNLAGCSVSGAACDKVNMRVQIVESLVMLSRIAPRAGRGIQARSPPRPPCSIRDRLAGKACLSSACFKPPIRESMFFFSSAA